MATAAPLPVVEVAPGVFVHEGAVELAAPANRGDIANLGFVVGTASVAVIDPGGSLAVGADLRDTIRAQTSQPVSAVVLTHMHPDHALGAAAFRGAGPEGTDPTFVAHAAFGEALATRLDAYRAEVRRELGDAAAAAFEPVFPTLAVAATATLELGGRTLTVTAWPTAHTNNDLTALDAATGTLFAGDLVFDRHLPALDGRLLGWLEVMDQMAELPAVRVVPGHGRAVLPFPAALGPQRAYLMQLAADVRSRIAAGEPLAEAVQSSPPPKGWLLVEAFHRRNVTAAYAELEWE